MTSAVRAVRIMSVVLLPVLSSAGVGYAAEGPYPNRSVRMVVSFAPGGGSDILARTIAPRLTTDTGQTWIVDNRAGAAGNIVAEIVVRAAPDGYTVLKALNTQLTANPNIYKLGFDVQRDLQPVTMLGTTEHVLVVHPSVPVKSLKEFIALAKQKPGELNYASAGVGTAVHMAAELVKYRTGVNLTHIAYKGGGPAVVAVVSGEAQTMTATPASIVPFLKAGRLRALVVTGPKRSKVVPDLPTMGELGFTNFDTSQWYGMFVPATTPKNIVEQMRGQIIKGMQHPDVRAALVTQGVELETTTPEELAARVKSETAAYATVIKAAGIRADQ